MFILAVLDLEILVGAVSLSIVSIKTRTSTDRQNTERTRTDKNGWTRTDKTLKDTERQNKDGHESVLVLADSWPRLKNPQEVLETRPGVSHGSLTYYLINLLKFSVIQTGIFYPGDLTLILSFCISASLYLAIIIKYSYNYSRFWIP